MSHGRYTRGNRADSHGTTGLEANPAEALSHLADRFEKRLARAAHGESSGVHRARVAARRLRAVLALRSDDAARRARREIRDVRRALGALREIDVAIERLQAETGRHAWPIKAVHAVRHALLEAREEECRRTTRRLQRASVSRVTKQLRRLAEDDRHATVAATSPAAQIRERARALDLAVSQVGPLYVPAALHQVRIAAKKLRYSLELSADAGDASLGRDLAALRRWQNRLGRLNDLHSLQTRVAGIAAHADVDLETSRGFDVIIRGLDRECRQLHASCLASASTLSALAARATLASLTPRGRARKMHLGSPSRPMVAKGA